MKKNFLANDARGNPSITLSLTVIAEVLVSLKFLFGGIVLPLLGEQPTMGPVEFATAFSLLLAPWLVREGVEKAASAKVEAAEVLADAKLVENDRERIV